MKRSRGISRSMYITLGLFAWLVAIPLGHGVLPWALSLLTLRHGWTAGRPGTWNLLGLIPVAAGAAGLAWTLAAGLARASELPRRLERLAPPSLMTYGPYTLTRNAMYVGEMALWLGWAILYGSMAVLAGFLVLLAAVIIIVPMEERTLEHRFGEAYRRYKATAPRWIWKRQ